jgi:thiol-disulfide isomerase/thioredoxin
MIINLYSAGYILTTSLLNLIKLKKFCQLCVLFLLCSCGKSGEKVIQTGLFSFAVFQNKPVFEEEYLYPQVAKKYRLLSQQGIQWYLIDWNDDGRYDEPNIDYMGLSDNTALRPVLTRLKATNSFKVDDQTYAVDSTSDYQIARRIKFADEVELSTITRFNQIELINGEIFDLAPKKERTILYFWATWCQPCIRTLKEVDLKKLERDDVELIPIAYDCTNVERFLNENDLEFSPLEISEQSADLYNLNALPKQYVFDQDGSLSGAKIDLKVYYKN